MKRLIPTIAVLFLCSIAVTITPTPTFAIPLDLNNFYLEGDGHVSADGLSAQVEIQDPTYGYTLLQNDPISSFGADPGIVVGADALSISFDFEFFEAPGNDTELYVRLLDGHNGDLIDSFAVDEASTGTHTFDLTALLTGQTLLGMDFTLTEYAGSDAGFNLGSWASISNLDLGVQEQVPIPEPATILLVGAGLIVLRRRARAKRKP